MSSEDRDAPSAELATLHVLRGAEHAAMERLIRASDITGAARVYVDEAARPGKSGASDGALTAIGLLTPQLSRVGAALVASATHRPGGDKQLARASRDLDGVLKALGPFPEKNRISTTEAGREFTEDILGDLLRETALELHDIDLDYGIDSAGEHVFTWRQESRETADAMLVGGLMIKMELMLASDDYLALEQIAGMWWYACHTPKWPTEADQDQAGRRAREWNLGDRVIPVLGGTAAESLPGHELWKPLSERQRRLVRAFAQSTSGIFAVRGTARRGVRVEDIFDGAMYDIIEEDPEVVEATDSRFYLGRVMPYDGVVHLKSTGTVLFRSAVHDLPDDLLTLLRGAVGAAPYRGPLTESIMGMLSGIEPAVALTMSVSADEARGLLVAYDKARAARAVGKGFTPRGRTTTEPDQVMIEWINGLRRAANPSEDPGEHPESEA